MLSDVAYLSPGVEMVELRWYLTVMKLAVGMARSLSYTIRLPPTGRGIRLYSAFCGLTVATA